MAESRPYLTEAALLQTADRLWWDLGEDDWLEAFRAHPRIGERGSARDRLEQAAALSSDRSVLLRLADCNLRYEQRFGYPFVIRASGRSVQEILHALEARLHNGPSVELDVAAHEELAITRLRLKRLLR